MGVVEYTILQAAMALETRPIALEAIYTEEVRLYHVRCRRNIPRVRTYTGL